MSTLRFNPFGQVHKGLRALLYDTALQIQKTNFSVTEETDQVVERVKLVNELFGHHAHVEDSQLFPMIQAYSPQLVDEFESQHEKDHALSASLETDLTRLAEARTAVDAICAGNELLQSFNAFLAFNVEHMKQEETLINACLWQYYTDAELLQKVQEISSSIPPEQNRHFIYWMLKGMATHEIIAWYKTIKHSAPPPVFRFFLDLAGEALSAENSVFISYHLIAQNWRFHGRRESRNGMKWVKRRIKCVIG